MTNDTIYDIIANFLLGTITQVEQSQLEAWLENSEDNKRQFMQFMQRNDMAEMYSVMKNVEKSNKKPADVTPIHNSHKNTARIAFISVAASIIIGIGIYMWRSYTQVIAPELDQMTLSALAAAEKAGRAGANVAIYDDKGDKMEVIEQIEELSSGVINIFDIAKSTFTADYINYTATISTEEDKEFWMTLSDGTRVHLNNNSKLTYPIIFNGKTREVTLEGEAYFCVAKDRRHPFIVHTQFGDIKEYGTEFVVNTSYDSRENSASEEFSGRNMSVVLVEGSISVTPKNCSEHMMVPNELAVVPFGGKSCLMKTVDTAPFISWNTGTFAFDCCPLEALMDVIGKWYKLDVEFSHNDYRTIQFTGELDRYDGIEDDLNAINQITGLNINVVEGKIIVE